MGNQLIREQIIEILESDYCDGGPTIGSIADKIKQLVNQEVERRIKERMPSEEEIEKAFTTEHYYWEQGRHYRVRKDRIFGAKWLRSRLTNPGANDSQKTEGGGE
jgi:hypothetical protein